MSHTQHHEKEYTILQVALNLFGACMVSGIIIAAVYYFTAPIALQKAEILKQEAMQALVTEADSFKPVEGHEGWFEAMKGSDVVAYVVPGDSKGFGGEIKMLVAVSKDGKVLNYDILKHNETPGLGDGANKPKFKDQFKNKSIDKLEVTKDPTNKDNIQAMTGATISSRAVTKGIKEAAEEVVKFAGGTK